MPSLLLLITMTLSGSTGPGSDEARRLAADVLRSTLVDLDRHEDGPPRLPRLLAAGESAADSLGQSPIAGELREAILEARSREAVEPGSAGPRLEDVLRRALADLEFEPILEADLPEGFPAPTPVGEIELKQYPLYRIARADGGSNGAFWQLFTHIKKHDIPMTAPVEMTYDEAGDEVDMAFMYEHAAQGKTGKDGDVEVIDIEPMLVVSLGCRGWASDTAVEQAKAKLTTWVRDQGDLAVVGATRQFGYNGPSVPPSQQYFEIQLPVRQLSGEQPAEVADPAGQEGG